MHRHTELFVLRSLRSLAFGALVAVLWLTRLAAAQPRNEAPLTLGQVAACAEGLAGTDGTDLETQPALIAKACLSGCQDLPLYYTDWSSVASLKSGACGLTCSGPAWEKAAAADAGERWQQLLRACPDGYFPLPVGTEPFVSPQLLVWARVGQLLKQAAASKDPAIAGAWMELYGWLKGRQFRLPLPPRLGGRYQLVSSEDPAIDSFDLGIYLWLTAKELRIGIPPTVKLSDRGALVNPAPEGTFPGQPVTLKELGPALSRANIALQDSTKRFGLRPDVNLDDLVPDDSLRKQRMSMRSPEEQLDRRAPLLLVDGNLPAVRLASVVTALGERGARLAVVAPGARVRWHSVRLRNPADQKAPVLSATLRLGAKGYSLWAGDAGKSSPIIADALPSGEKRAKLLRHNVPQWINKSTENPARLECGANLPVAEVIAALDSLAGPRIRESALVIR